ncbi:hypothetical protein PP175_09880 [Aneurinibacillus sp. Ricciae_BoGa-3]|uniref:hypothetical protein n=1 Tax=Aneurinibacillus sp. Ricciae_BoGa-3 TaxID=3022697 RepID=UPI00234162B3|nr:hypothetical protein [Aneurinibacillus sp. Ricciae_BoGa-3]WCK56190.1 hypothetical protein PP175_09880 [Aneurinibacillus sp. Ricciae_BoGa-3]
MTVYEGTHVWIWQPWNIYGGDVNQLITACKQRGIDGVIIKFANGSLANDQVSQRFMDYFKKYAGPLKAAGITVGGWIYQYLTDPLCEVDACTQAIGAGADWIVFDAETEIKGKGAQVTQFLQAYRAKHPHTVTGLSSFAIADYHTDEVPFAEYAKYVDVLMPQIYWDEMKWPVEVAFLSSVTSYKKYNKPIAPTGQSYLTAKPSDMAKFVQLCKSNGFRHVSWWDWDEASPEQLNAIEQNRIQIVNSTPQPVPEDWRIREINAARTTGIFTSDHKPGEPVTIEVLAAALNNLYKLIKGGNKT